jgi:hypothetical protein
MSLLHAQTSLRVALHHAPVIGEAINGSQITGYDARGKRRFLVSTTDSNHKLQIAPNRLNRNFTVAMPNTVWIGDVTYIATDEGWLYLVAADIRQSAIRARKSLNRSGGCSTKRPERQAMEVWKSPRRFPYSHSLDDDGISPHPGRI